MVRKHALEFIAVSAVFVLVFGFFTIRYIHALTLNQEQKDELILSELARQEKQLENAQLAIDVLVSENKAVAERIQEETNKRIVAEAARQSDAAKAQQKIAELEQNISNKAPDLTAIIQQWRPRIASVKCESTISNGSAISSGSGVLFMSAGVPTLITNKHIFFATGKLPESCRIKFPDISTGITIEADAISYAEKQDFASIDLSSARSEVASLASSAGDRCSENAVAGDTIIILGYPSIGSKTDITATEGIISGYDKPHYITSAKIERGNSGGAAILAKQKCYLGIPTFVSVGQIEALARILDQKTISF